MLRTCLRSAAFAALIVQPLTVHDAAAQSLARIVPLQTVRASGPENQASGRVLIFEGSRFTGDMPVLDFSVKDLICRSGGLDPIDPSADQIGAAFYGIYLKTVSDPVGRRLHIFNTDCSTNRQEATYLFLTYLTRTGQSASDVLTLPITVEIRLERDQDGDGLFEENFLILQGTD